MATAHAGPWKSLFLGASIGSPDTIVPISTTEGRASPRVHHRSLNRADKCDVHPAQMFLHARMYRDEKSASPMARTVQQQDRTSESVPTQERLTARVGPDHSRQ